MKTLGLGFLVFALVACGDDENPADDTGSAADTTASATDSASDTDGASTSQPDTSQPDTSQPDTSQPDTSQPDSAEPTDTSEPEPDVSAPTDTSASDTASGPSCDPCDPWVPHCVADNTCGECRNDGDCSGAGFEGVRRCTQNLVPADPWNCVECLTVADCAVGQKHCEANSCYGCSSASDCSAPTPMCNLSGGPGFRQCYGCTKQADCRDTYCDSGSGMCTACTENAQCAGHPQGNLCRTGSVVVRCGCDSANDCSDTKYSTCHPTLRMCTNFCETDADCVGSQAGGHCDASTKICEP